MSVRCIWCKKPKVVKTKVHYLGVKFVHECECGVKLCVDITGQDWCQMGKEELKRHGMEVDE